MGSKLWVNTQRSKLWKHTQRSKLWVNTQRRKNWEHTQRSKLWVNTQRSKLWKHTQRQKPVRDQGPKGKLKKSKDTDAWAHRRLVTMEVPVYGGAQKIS